MCNVKNVVFNHETGERDEFEIESHSIVSKVLVHHDNGETSTITSWAGTNALLHIGTIVNANAEHPLFVQEDTCVVGMYLVWSTCDENFQHNSVLTEEDGEQTVREYTIIVKRLVTTE